MNFKKLNMLCANMKIIAIECKKKLKSIFIDNKL